MLEEPFESYSQLLPLLKSRTAKRHSQLSYCIDKMSEFTPSQIQKANNQPLDYLSPFLSLFQAYFSRNMHQLRRTHWEWLHHELGGSSITQTERDNLIFATWNTARSILEDFSMLTDQLEDYATELGYELSNDTKEASAITQSQAKHRKMLERARNLELHVRDTIQLNVSSLSLRESRRSITQADSIGRITFLAFIFLPLSLVTSFFGMNIQELTGNGFSWKVFGAVTAVLCTLTAMVCLWMWRGRFTWFTWLLYAPIMAPLAISQFLWIIMIEFWDSSVHEMWHGPIGQLVTDWWSLGPFGKIL
ncbi:hypothetical protein BGZ60DRAFT_193086 [Tricladium varicosporioides]|nr:hypothetical protein BGZ60DRAFT_193086 [Hymenoscyphus varicosporioides]